MLNRVVGFFLLLITWPAMVLFALLVWIFSGRPIFYYQDRVGFRGKVFKIIKFRTMRKDADVVKENYRALNEADGPVFKIRNDPRLTSIGRFLFHSGLDEMPQFINMIRGEMVLVGPRPLPIDEAKNLKKEYRKREMVKPGILSLWVLNGYHKMKFDDWMKSDLEYIKDKSIAGDIVIIFRGCALMWRLFWRELVQFFQ